MGAGNVPELLSEGRGATRDDFLVWPTPRGESSGWFEVCEYGWGWPRSGCEVLGFMLITWWLCEGCKGAEWIESDDSEYEGAKMVSDFAFFGFFGDGIGLRLKAAKEALP